MLGGRGSDRGLEISNKFFFSYFVSFPYQIIELTEVAMVCRSPTKMMRTMLLSPTPNTPISDWRTQNFDSPWLSCFDNFRRSEVWVILLSTTTATLQLLPIRMTRIRTLKCFSILVNNQIRTEQFPLSLLMSARTPLTSSKRPHSKHNDFLTKIIVPSEHS